ncbi:Protein Iojap/ribosomal silencing factor RsfS [Oxalobacteraceae bacterium]
MDIKKLQGIVVNALEDVKAQDIRIFDTTHLTSMFDRIAIASGTSNRQTKALASSVRDSVKAAGGQILSMEGEGTGEWVLVDLGDMVVHIMQPAIRAYYRLEELWGEKEIKLGAATRSATGAKTTLVKASSHITKTAVKKTARTKVSDIKASDTKAPAKKAVAEKTAVTKSAGTKTPAKKAVAKKTVAKKAIIKKVVAKKATPKKSAAKKAPARKTASTAGKTSASRSGAGRRTTTKSGG